MRPRGVRTLVPEGALMCRTHMTQHELSAIAPNFQCVQLFASLGFADIRVGATSADILVEVVRTCTHARMHAASCAACTQAPVARKPSRLFAYAACPPDRPPAPFARALRAHVHHALALRLIGRGIHWRCVTRRFGVMSFRMKARAPLPCPTGTGNSLGQSRLNRGLPHPTRCRVGRSRP